MTWCEVVITWAQPQLRALLVLYVVAYALGFMLTANVSARQAAHAALRGLLVGRCGKQSAHLRALGTGPCSSPPCQIRSPPRSMGHAITVSSAQQFDKSCGAQRCA